MRPKPNVQPQTQLPLGHRAKNQLASDLNFTSAHCESKHENVCYAGLLFICVGCHAMMQHHFSERSKSMAEVRSERLVS